MNLLDIPYKKSITIKNDVIIQTKKQEIFITKCLCNTDKNDSYYLRINSGENRVQGYLYFYLNQEKRQSKFIGVSTLEESRNCGIASLLIASWIQLCLEEGFTNLETIPKQKKPFPLYILKKYFFDHRNISDYQASTKTVYICRREEGNQKCISFLSKQEENRFRNSNIMKMDNYQIVDREDTSLQILDSVVLYTPYFLQNQEKAYQKSLQIYNKYR